METSFRQAPILIRVIVHLFSTHRGWRKHLHNKTPINFHLLHIKIIPPTRAVRMQVLLHLPGITADRIDHNGASINDHIPSLLPRDP